MTPHIINILDISVGCNLTDYKAIIFWHHKEPDQFKAKVVDVFEIPDTVYMACGKLIPKIAHELEMHGLYDHLYTLI